MASQEPAKKKKGCGLVGCFWGVFVIGLTSVLSIVLMDACTAGQETLGAYIDGVRGGAAVSEAVAGAEAPAVTEALRQSTGFSVDNFQAQSNTACFWLQLEGPNGTTPVRFVLAGERVLRASLVRECECPDPDFEQPCRLR